MNKERYDEIKEILNDLTRDEFRSIVKETDKADILEIKKMEVTNIKKIIKELFRDLEKESKRILTCRDEYDINSAGWTSCNYYNQALWKVWDWVMDIEREYT